jgi:peptide chain release factor 2
MSAPNFWDRPSAARALCAESAGLKRKLDTYHSLVAQVSDVDALIEFGADDVEFRAQVPKAFAKVMEDLASFEIVTHMAGPFDTMNAFVIIHAGAGGTEAADWAEMLYRMFARWADRRGMSAEMLDYTEGESAGYRSVTLKVDGLYAFGYLQNERGVHRLVRISPFDAQNRRHTSFCSVDVTPEVDDDVPIEIRDVDLHIDTFRSGGKGGQNVNKVETAVRITHLPSGVIVACQNARSQGKNKELAMGMLKAKLYQIQEDKKSAEVERQYGEKGEIAWGSQIRSYVFQPYQLVKDHRTGLKTANVSGVMDGDLDPFIEAKLRGMVAGDTTDELE